MTEEGDEAVAEVETGEILGIDREKGLEGIGEKMIDVKITDEIEKTTDENEETERITIEVERGMRENFENPYEILGIEKGIEIPVIEILEIIAIRGNRGRETREIPETETREGEMIGITKSVLQGSEACPRLEARRGIGNVGVAT